MSAGHTTVSNSYSSQRGCLSEKSTSTCCMETKSVLNMIPFVILSDYQRQDFLSCVILHHITEGL